MLNAYSSRWASAPALRRQAGLSMVELMVGVAIGLFVVAGATLAVSNQLGDNRRLMLETQIQQDLRAAADVISRDIRRSGYWGKAETGIWASGAAAAASNPYTGLQPAVSATPASAVTFGYSRDAIEDDVLDVTDQSGFRLNSAGAIEMLVGGAWQALTDSTTLRVTSFQVTLNSVDLPLSCFNACAPGALNCPPTQSVRNIGIAIAGQAVFDATVKRTATASVRIRNDVVTGACPAS